MSGFYNWAVDCTHSSISYFADIANPDNKAEKEELKTGLHLIQMSFAVATVVTGIFATVGLAGVIGGTASGAGFAANTVLAYVSYNCYHMSVNAEDLVDKPSKYGLGKGKELKINEIFTQLGKNTVFFDWALKVMADLTKEAIKKD